MNSPKRDPNTVTERLAAFLDAHCNKHGDSIATRSDRYGSLTYGDLRALMDLVRVAESFPAAVVDAIMRLHGGALAEHRACKPGRLKRRLGALTDLAAEVHRAINAALSQRAILATVPGTSTPREPCLLCGDTGITLDGLANIDLDAGLPCPQLPHPLLATVPGDKEPTQTREPARDAFRVHVAGCAKCDPPLWRCEEGERLRALGLEEAVQEAALTKRTP